MSASNRNVQLIIGIAVALAASLFVVCIQGRRIQRLTDERDKYRSNTESLLSDVERFKVRDSLNAARVQSLELTTKEYERSHAEDAELIKSLKGKNRDLQAVLDVQTQMVVELSTRPVDTLIIRDSVKIPAISLHCGDEWYDFDGLLADGEFSGTMVSRDSLVAAETVRYKRFLGFLWKTKKIKDRRIDIVSRNPHTEIKDVSFVRIEK